MDKLKATHIAEVSKMVDEVEVQLSNLVKEWRDALKRAQVDGTYDKIQAYGNTKTSRA